MWHIYECTIKFVHKCTISYIRPGGLMVRRCFPVAKIAGSSPVWVVLFALLASYI